MNSLALLRDTLTYIPRIGTSGITGVERPSGESNGLTAVKATVSDFFLTRCKQ